MVVVQDAILEASVYERMGDGEGWWLSSGAIMVKIKGCLARLEMKGCKLAKISGCFHLVQLQLLIVKSRLVIQQSALAVA